ncbi:kinase-like domain-containing protein [Aspergillus affinis]|uniref:kinase-like domain-containing protein n=1 Tax=Aspergillus affinis TaxID=1070780 RepID=UPI0022FEA040|nr:kinase-like domain-containing protein [Aspergillus affinis]KAI9045164.1 kinase-like domain-containing protein [Aspergillus affinis]
MIVLYGTTWQGVVMLRPVIYHQIPSSRLIPSLRAVLLHRRHLISHPFGSSKQLLSTTTTPCVTSAGSNQNLFTYTAGRYIFNEKRRLEKRYDEFDVEALKTVAASSVGPSADYTFWRVKRASLDLDRRPWRDHRDYVRSVGCREFEWTRRYGKPQQNDFPHNNIVKGDISPGIYLDLLQKFLSLAPYILPEDRESPMNMPTMRHPDLNPSNVFVLDSCEISCIVDWQHSSILPLILTAGNPPLFKNPDSEPPASLEKPSLSDDYNSLGPEERSKTEELHRRRMLFYLYMVFNGRDNKAHLEALRYPLLPFRQHLVDRAGRQWSGNVITLKRALIRLTERWEQLGNNLKKKPCPVNFNEEESEEFYRVEKDWFKATILLEHWRSLLDDLGEDGRVRNEAYEAVMETTRRLRRSG